MPRWKTLKIFISWSGDRSHLFGAAIRKWLPKILDPVDIWMSDDSISKGTRWYDEIMDGLKEYQIGIMCLTPENYDAPWMNFEAGILHANSENPMICPVLLGMGKDDFKSPLSEFQATVFTKEDFLKLILSLNERLREDCQVSEKIIENRYEKYWPLFEKDVEEVSRTTISIHGCSVPNVIKALSKSGFSKTDIGRQAFFASGFESHTFYSSVLELANEKLYFFGRKNRKLFDKEHFDFFAQLKEKTQNGFDFKVLFLDSNSPEEIIDLAHKNKNFKQELKECIEHAKTVLNENNLDPSEFCRKYNFLRTIQIVVIDNAIAYSSIIVDSEGKVRRLTKAPFNIIESDSEYGKELLDNFLIKWEQSKPL
ncbi:MAG: TIR domain-containing protein [Candidatus Heimdallarchaeota archaeon]